MFFLCSILLCRPRASGGPCKVPGTIPPALWPQCPDALWTFTRHGRLAGAGGLGVKLPISLSSCIVSHSSFESEWCCKATPPECTQQRCHSSHLYHSHPQHLHHSLWGAEDWPLPYQEFSTLLSHGAMESGKKGVRSCHCQPLEGLSVSENTVARWRRRRQSCTN